MAHIGTNLVSWIVILPILIIVAIGIIWYLTKVKGSLLKRVATIASGLFTFIGFSVILLGVYYHLNSAFAGTFKFYAYSTLAPQGSPFNVSKGGYGTILMSSEVYNDAGQIKLLSQLKPNLPSYVTVFSSGQYINTKIDNGVLTIPPDVAGSELQVNKTSLWWALTKDLTKLNVSEK